MSWFRQYLTAFRNDGTPSDGLFEKADGTVWLRNPDGSETQVGSGGSQPVVYRLPFAFNTAGIVTPGAALWTPPEGFWFAAGYPSLTFSITTPFNGTTPKLDIGAMVAGVFTTLGGSLADATVADIQLAGSFKAGQDYNPTVYQFTQTGTDPLAVQLSDGASGDPGSTAGAGAIIIFGGLATAP